MRRLKRFFSNKIALAVCLAAVLAGVFVASLCIGSVSVPPGKVFSALLGRNPDAPETRIVLYVRLPRSLAALTAGVGLAVSGAVFQSILNNPLASSGIMGVNAGGGVMVLVAAAALPTAFYARPLFAFFGAVGAALIVYLVAVKSGAGRTTIVLAGVAVSAFLTAIIDLIVTVFPALGVDRLAFTVGGFSGVTMRAVAVSALLTAVGLAVSFCLSFDLNMLGLGDELAGAMGMRVRATKLLAVLAAAMLSGAAIALAGLVGFVGLIVPHLVRLAVGGDNRTLLPLTALLGGAFTMACDLIARTAFSPFELPVGILLAAVGAPFFLWLLVRKGGRHARKL